MAKRTGKRLPREQLLKRRVPELGYYLIVTDTKATEQNYIAGLRDSIPKKLQGKIVVKVCRAETAKLVDEALSMASMHPQYSEPWIVFDRDQVKDFDRIIANAEGKGIKVGWSNPCIEIWFSAYLGAMPVCQDSVTCNDNFEARYFNITGHRYDKTDSAIYSKLCRFGDEKQAFSLAKQKLLEHARNNKTQPSNMCPATKLHILVEEINNKVVR